MQWGHRAVGISIPGLIWLSACASTARSHRTGQWLLTWPGSVAGTASLSSPFTWLYLHFPAISASRLPAFQDATKCIRSNMNISVPKLDGRARSTFRKDPKNLNSEQKYLVSAVMNYKEGINAFYMGLSCKKASSFICVVVCAPRDAAFGFPPAMEQSWSFQRTARH